jgi:outer membrane protein
MKNISFALNIVLLVAVGFLYYKNFSGGKPENSSTKEDKDSLNHSSSAISFSKLPENMPIVFINADTIFAKYEYAKKVKALNERKMMDYQKTYQAKADAFQKEYNDYVEKAGAGAYTKEQGLAIEAELQKKRDEILAMEQNHDKVMNELDKSNMDVQRKIYDYLTRFNKEHGYYCTLAYTKTGGGVLGIHDSLDVTKQVLEGLNAEYAKEKK